MRDGHPAFGVISVGRHRGRPENLVFASDHEPDLRDAVHPLYEQCAV
jgi:hypothetical protein